jgi:RING finger/CHY zinc finger protein 1
MDPTNINNILLPDECVHYIRGCKILAPCCDKIFDCRVCHDLEMDEREMDSKKQHKLIQSTIRKMLCKSCDLLQDFSQICASCKECMGTYYCEYCKFVDSNSLQSYFHCDKCGMCRRGKKNEYEHCDECGCCFMIGHKKNTCSKNKLNNNCPICFDDMNNSIITSVPMECGHMIHTTCYAIYARTNYKCPLCCKTMFKILELAQIIKLKIQETPMPEEYKDIKVNILCNDCGKTSNVGWHVVAMFCPECDSFNTKQI